MEAMFMLSSAIGRIYVAILESAEISSLSVLFPAIVI